jgi:hypothetical protein
LLATAASLVIGLSTAAVAQTKKSTEATAMGEGAAIYVHPKGRTQIQRQGDCRAA